jgi:hypothetical protein
MKLSESDFASACNALQIPHASVKIRAGLGGKHYELTLRVVSWTALTYRVFVYVDGRFVGEWMNAKKECPEQAFLRKSSKKILNKSDIEFIARASGKSKAKEAAEKRLVTYHPDFASGTRAINHIQKTAESVELLSIY